MDKTFLLSALLTTAVNLLLFMAAHFVFLKDFIENHPAVSEECMKELHRPPDQLIAWAMIVSAVTMGLLITTAMKWSNARTFASGLKKGFIFAFLFWSSVNFGLYASSNLFSTAGVFADLACSITAMTISAAVASSILGRGKNK